MLFWTQLSVLCLAVGADPAAPPPEVDNHLASNGVYRAVLAPFRESGKEYALPGPVLGDGLTADQQDAAFRRFFGRSYEKYLEPGTVRRKYYVKNDVLFGDGGQLRRRTCCFAVYGDLRKLADPEFLRKNLTGEQVGETYTLSAEELADRQITIAPELKEQEYYSQVRAKLDKKIQVEVVTHSLWTKSEGSLVAAAITDARFEKDAQFPSVWMSISDGPGNRLPYPNTVRVYARFTEVKIPKYAGALFAQVELAYYEPKKWFEGRDTLTTWIGNGFDRRIDDLRRGLLDGGK